MGRIPDRWLDYKPIGEVIPGTRFIAFKCPLREAICYNLPKSQWFTPQDIIDQKPKVLLVVDLTNTTKYYDKNVFEQANITYKKIFVQGHITPRDHLISEFFDSVDKFLEEHPSDDSLIGVHCTHGVNRTGYFICKYMIDKLGVDPGLAIQDVGRSRGYPIERINYLGALKGEAVEEPQESDWRAKPSPHQRDRQPAPVSDWRAESSLRQQDRGSSYSRNRRDDRQNRQPPYPRDPYSRDLCDDRQEDRQPPYPRDPYFRDRWGDRREDRQPPCPRDPYSRDLCDDRQEDRQQPYSRDVGGDRVEDSRSRYHERDHYDSSDSLQPIWMRDGGGYGPYPNQGNGNENSRYKYSSRRTEFGREERRSRPYNVHDSSRSLTRSRDSREQAQAIQVGSSEVAK